ncbi:hypothetical protein EJB05_19270 [Eragrostis curvula]|uniref:ABC transporter domain-containing protein n=1 Tax=Eragrostis curvula TaxID=38414 RepID=A0A5J9UV57_9POAL|nr:hypothetical protein EJB05_19270 [Eragrostis curvula]
MAGGVGNGEEGWRRSGIEVSALQFGYEGQPPVFARFNLRIAPGSRCLLVGANGSGKTTLLKILAGKHMVGGRDVVRVLNGSAFHDTQLVCNGDLSYLGGSWSRTIGSAGDVPLQGDFSAEHMIFGDDLSHLLHIGFCINVAITFVAYPNLLGTKGYVVVVAITFIVFDGVDPVRREKLIDLLDIDLQWRMHKVSDGQRRRVQICMGLLHPYKVLLLDEITVDLDVVTRMDLLDFFKEECEQREATIVYATHIFDGLETWATDVAYIQEGELRKSAKYSDIEELKRCQKLAVSSGVMAPI